MRDDNPAGADGTGADGTGADGDDQRSQPGDVTGAGPGELLSDLSRLRRRTRVIRHGYWFPLVLFGVLGCAAAPLYLASAASIPTGSATYQPSNTGPLLLGGAPTGRNGFYIGWYWTIALVAGYLLTVLWYWRSARRAGVRTPARGYVITGIVLTGLAVILPPLSQAVPALFRLWAPLGDAWIRGTLAFLIIAVGLWVLARAERSPGLAVIALAYTAAALLASLYNVENILFRLGWNPATSSFGWDWTALPDILLPALVLLLSGLGAFLVQRLRRPA
jgi:uncharacterized membrane protein